MKVCRQEMGWCDNISVDEVYKVIQSHVAFFTAEEQ